VKLDAFPFTKYGAVPDGRLGPVYHMRVAPDRQTLEVEGRPLHLTPGMRGSGGAHFLLL
jgi:hypothetical protein